MYLPMGLVKKPAAVDMVFAIDNEKWIAVEIELLVGAGKEFEDELMNCVWGAPQLTN